MKSTRRLASVLLLAWLVCVSLTRAAVPHTIAYQGRLTDPGGTPLSGSSNLTFRLYTAPTGGIVLWTETQPVTVTAGLFDVALGSVTPLSEATFSDTLRWLGIQSGADPEMTPRTQIRTVPFAFRVGTVDGATGGTVQGNLTVNGNLTTVQQSRYLTISPALYDHSLAANGMLLSLGGWRQSIGGNSGALEIPLILPDSAWIDSIQIFVLDSSASRDLNASMKYYFPLSTLNSGAGTTVSTSGVPGLTVLQVVDSPFLTNFSNFSYAISLSWIAPSPEPASSIRVGVTKVWYRK